MFVISRLDFTTLCLFFHCAQCGFRYERFAHVHQPPFNPCAIMGGFGVATPTIGTLRMPRLAIAQSGGEIILE
ncbi:MAG: hypothetical protein WCH04_16730 [Gammaproteobacteria bacterium]